MQETLVKCGLLACAVRETRAHRDALDEARKLTRQPPSRARFGENRHQKIFLDFFAESHRRRSDCERNRANRPKTDSHACRAVRPRRRANTYEIGRRVRKATIRSIIEPSLDAHRRTSEL